MDVVIFFPVISMKLILGFLKCKIEKWMNQGYFYSTLSCKTIYSYHKEEYFRKEKEFFYVILWLCERLNMIFIGEWLVKCWVRETKYFYNWKLISWITFERDTSGNKCDQGYFNSFLTSHDIKILSYKIMTSNHIAF